ncbi:MAG: hypothetical protein JSW56_17470 [Deltaproteobacteria bacterium]|nr:MAG: hypothetical protein JSW56_17470 [Deltaproteobacteria bacterium]
MRVLLSVMLALFLFVPAAVQAQQGANPGTFSAIKMDQDVVDHVLTEGNDIFVKVHPDYWNAEFLVKISNENMAGYRQWLSGSWEYPTQVYRSNQKGKQGYTYRINTAAKYVEYWTGGKLVLHLMRGK